MAQRVVVWRHGRTQWNLAGRFQGQSDVELDEVGVEQAANAARILTGLKPAAIISSDLKRAWATAAELGTLTGLQVVAAPGLRETYLGTWQGLTREEVAAKFPGEEEAWLRGDVERRGGGESMQEVATRAADAVRAALAELGPDDTLVAVTHGGSGRVLIGSMCGLPPEHWSVLGVLSNCSWSLLAQRSHRWSIAEHNAGTLPEPVLADER